MEPILSSSMPTASPVQTHVIESVSKADPVHLPTSLVLLNSSRLRPISASAFSRSDCGTAAIIARRASSPACTPAAAGSTAAGAGFVLPGVERTVMLPWLAAPAGAAAAAALLAAVPGAPPGPVLLLEKPPRAPPEGQGIKRVWCFRVPGSVQLLERRGLGSTWR